MIFRLSKQLKLSPVAIYRRHFSATPKLRIVFGSQTGTAEAFANDLEFDAQDLQLETELIDASNFSIKELTGSENTLTAFVMACYGEGDPTDNAKKFYAELFSKEMDQAQLGSASYAIFGLGNSQCFRDRFNVVGKRIDQRLEELGGHRLLPCGEGDASKNINAEFTAWKTEFLKISQEFHPPTALPVQSGAPVKSDATPAATAAAVSTPFIDSNIALSVRQLALAPSDRPILLAQVKETAQLFTAVDEFSSAMHVTFDLNETGPLIANGCSGLTPKVMTSNLQAGDHIGIFPPNSRHVVERFVVAAGLSLDALEAPYQSGSNDTLRQVLTWQLNLTSIAPITSLKVLHRWAQDPAASVPLTAQYLQNLIDNYDQAFRSKGYDVSSVLEMIPKRRVHSTPIPLTALLKTLPPLAPRLYSLTHNPVTNHESASLLCRLLRYRPSPPYIMIPSSRVVDGVASSYLNEGIAPGDKVALFFRESNFHLPTNPLHPVIMIAGGTGLAPFMSFLEERMRIYQTLSSTSKDRPALAPAVLYFGSRNADEYMFREELLRFIKDSDGVVLSKLMVSFSSPNDHQKITSRDPREIILAQAKHIPTVALEDTEYLTSLIDQGGHIYVCGGAGNFGKAVRYSVNELVKGSISGKSISHSDEVEQEGVRLLVQEKRYYEDLAD